MNWEALGAIGEIVGAVAVVLTLGYLALQMRQNTAALRTTSREEIASGFRTANRLLLEPGVARAYAEGLRAYPDMPFDERRSCWVFMTDHSLAFQGAFALYESGQLEEETYQAYLTWIACHYATPGGAAWWADTGRRFFTRRMVEAVDARLALGDLPDIRELAPFHVEETAPDQASVKPQTSEEST
jgi:hypothetical protein